MTAPVPEISVVVAVYNGGEHIQECLDALRAQNLPRERFEIIVVDDGSTDATPEICRAASGVRYVRQRNEGPSSARNNGVRLARAPVVAFTDADCIPGADWLGALLDAFEDAGIAAAGGPHTGPDNAPPYASAIDCYLQRIGFATGYIATGMRAEDVGHVPSCNAAYRRETFWEAGGFRPGLFPGEDVDLDKRMRDRGHRIRFVPDAHVHHHRPETPAQWKRMLCAYGQSSGNNIRIHGPFRVIHWLPPGLLVALASVPVLLPWPRYALASALLLLGAFAALAAWVGRPPLGFRKAAKLLLQTALHFSLGYWQKLIRPSPGMHSLPHRRMPTK